MDAGNTSFLCFESPAHAGLYAELYPERAQQLFSFASLIEILAGPLPTTAAERLTQFQQVADEPDPRRAERLLQTIEILRAGLLQSQEDLSFLFSQLAPTPKNDRLQRVFARYLESPLAEDFPARAWRAIEKVRHSQNASLPAVTYFVPDSPAHFFFDEMAAAFQTAGASSRRVESHELILSPDEPRNHRPFVYQGSAAEALLRLADRMAVLVRRKISPDQILIPFSGDAGERGLLLARLAFHGINPAAVRLFPFHPVPQDDRWHVLSYVGRNALEPPHGHLLLREAELEALHRQGFCIPRLSAHRSRLKQQMEIAARGQRTRRELFTALPLEEVPPKIRRWTLKAQPRAVPSQSSASRIAIERRALSATQLETYAKCPAQYFYSQVLRVRPQDPAGEDSFALWFGSSAHLALENYFRKPAETPGLIAEFEAALQICAEGIPANHPLKALAREKFRKMAEGVEKLEAELTALVGPHQAKQFEMPFKVSFEGIELTGKIDRLDQTPQKEWIILDYKTGSVDFSPEHIRKGKNFQALLYWLAAERMALQPLAGMLFYDLKQEELRRGIFREEALSKDAKKRLTRGHALPKEKLEGILEEGIAHLRHFASQIQLGEFAATPAATACGYCEYGTLCRKGALYG